MQYVDREKTNRSFSYTKERSQSILSGSRSSALYSNKSTDNELEVVEKIYQLSSGNLLDTEGLYELSKPLPVRIAPIDNIRSATTKRSFSYEKYITSTVPIVRNQVEQTRVWDGICEASDEGRSYLQEIKKTAEEPKEHAIHMKQEGNARNYLDHNIFNVLLPALEETLLKAQDWDCLEVQKCRFNGVDNLAEILWNCNPQYPQRAKNWKTIFNIPFAKKWLKEHPRPFYPPSWLWSKEKAALIIQSAVRGFLVRCQPEVQEMRQFWKALKKEQLEEQRRRQEEVEKWRMQLNEEQEQRKVQEAERFRQLQEIIQKEEEAAMKSRAQQVASKEKPENVSQEIKHDKIRRIDSLSSADSYKQKLLTSDSTIRGSKDSNLTAQSFDSRTSKGYKDRKTIPGKPSLETVHESGGNLTARSSSKLKDSRGITSPPTIKFDIIKEVP